MRTLPRHQSLDDFPLPVLRGQPFIYDFWHHESIRVFTRSRSISSFVTIAPLRAKGRKPRKASLAVPPFEVPFASVRPRRASSERIRPAVLCSRRANSLAACRTSSSISRVVLIHLMIKHQNKGAKTFHHGAPTGVTTRVSRLFMTFRTAKHSILEVVHEDLRPSSSEICPEISPSAARSKPQL